MLEKTLTERISLEFNFEDDLWPVRLDQRELEEAVINMCINAMDSIDGKGKLTLRTRNKSLKLAEAKRLQLEPGDYIILSVADTGSGMDEVTKEKVFDPFFTTKGDKGTGLGLTQVYGVVQRSAGAIHVHSESGIGSRFSLYFPVI
jgi:signal transduction histidine kinase